MIGRWDEALAIARRVHPRSRCDRGGIVLSLCGPQSRSHRGQTSVELDAARPPSRCSRGSRTRPTSGRYLRRGSRAALRAPRARPAEALARRAQALEVGRTLGVARPAVKQASSRRSRRRSRSATLEKADELLASIDGAPAGDAAAVPRRAGAALPARGCGRRRAEPASRPRPHASASSASPSGSRSRCSSTARLASGRATRPSRCSTRPARSSSACGRRRGSSGSTAIGADAPRSGMTCPPAAPRTAEAQKFCGECGAALARRLPGVRRRQHARAEVLRRVRRRARRAPAPTPRRARIARRPSGASSPSSSPTSSASRRSPRAATPRRCASSSPLLRHAPAADRALRRHGREVHRRRGDGGVGHADRDTRTTPSALSGRRSTSSRPCLR